MLRSMVTYERLDKSEEYLTSVGVTHMNFWTSRMLPQQTPAVVITNLSDFKTTLLLLVFSLNCSWFLIGHIFVSQVVYIEIFKKM